MAPMLAPRPADRCVMEGEHGVDQKIIAPPVDGGARLSEGDKVNDVQFQRLQIINSGSPCAY